MLHNTLEARQVLSWFFENFVTDQYSILYSHFTVETVALSKFRLKLYFYDGLTEQKLVQLGRKLVKFKYKKLRSHKRMLRRFRKVRYVKALRSGFLRL